jgi:hypothetical protein
MVITPASVWTRMSWVISFQCFLDKINPVLAPEHLVADKEGRGAEDTAVHGFLGVAASEPVLDLGVLRQRQQRLRVESRRLCSTRAHGGRVVQVLRVDPDGRNTRRSSRKAVGLAQLQATAPRISVRVLIGKCGLRFSGTP